MRWCGLSSKTGHRAGTPCPAQLIATVSARECYAVGINSGAWQGNRLTPNGKRLLFVNMTDAPTITLNIGYWGSKGVLLYICLTVA